MKPDWKDAPEWAKWLAQDEDGSWCWYEFQPFKCGSYWAEAEGQYKYVPKTFWEDTLEERPTDA